MKGIDECVARVAAKQHGLVTLEQLCGLGVSRHQIQARVRRGQWAKADRRVVRICGWPVTWHSQLLAAVLGAGPWALASHRSAARLWQLDGVTSAVPEITVPRGCRYRARKQVVVHESTDLDRTTATAIDGIPTTLVARTLLDLGAVLRPQLVHVALDCARRKRLTNWNVLLSTLTVHARKGRSGVGALRAILDDHFDEVAKTESGFERLVLIALCEAGLPPPVLQHEVRLRGHRRYRLDLAYPDHRLAIELDGAHHRDKDVWEDDHVRQNALVNAGWKVLRFTWRDYTARRSAMITEVKAALLATEKPL
jgi:very-short-patch-repair endonuclease